MSLTPYEAVSLFALIAMGLALCTKRKRWPEGHGASYWQHGRRIRGE